MIYKLSIYACNSRNFKKDGKLSKMAVHSFGSFTQVVPSGQPVNVDIPALIRYGYTNIHVAPLDPTRMYMKDKQGEECIAFLSACSDTSPVFETLSFLPYINIK